jgi:hypothetical protein
VVLHRDDAVWLVPAIAPTAASLAGISQSAVALDLATNTDERIYFKRRFGPFQISAKPCSSRFPFAFASAHDKWIQECRASEQSGQF